MGAAEQVGALQAALPRLDQRSQDFAQSLLSQFARRGLSDKQLYWVGQLVQRATAPQPRAQAVGDVQGIVALLETAQQRLKSPALLVRAQDRDFRLTIAKGGQLPGSINVTSVGSYDERQWYGRITQAGEYQPSRRYDASTQTAIGLALKAMASDPARAAGAYGKLTGRCCFCGLALTDQRSTAVGYGPVCAKNWGVPWGKEGDKA